MEFCWDSRPLTPAAVAAAATLSPPQARQSSHQRIRRRRTRKITADTLELQIKNVNKHICFLNAYGVLVCKEHATGVLNLDVHLRSYHGVASELRRSIVQHCSRWPIKPAKAVELPAPLGSPIKELGQPLDGLACKQDSCDFITVNINTLRMHIKEKHDVL